MKLLPSYATYVALITYPYYIYIYIALTFEGTKLIRMYPPYNNKQGYVRNIIYIWDNMDIHAFRINKGRGHGRVQVIIKHCYYLILDGVLALVIPYI